jgi:6,7-dimethyl-8-ribityllumazine synthase
MKIEGSLTGENKKIAIISSRFNELVVKELHSGALSTLMRCGVNESHIDEVFVPGAFEIPMAALTLAKSGRYDGIVCLGAVIRGETTHYDYVCNEVAKGINHVQLTTGVPCSFGVITTENLEQALHRAGSKVGNKGSEAALVTIEMVNLINKITK